MTRENFHQPVVNIIRCSAFSFGHYDICVHVEFRFFSTYGLRYVTSFDIKRYVMSKTDKKFDMKLIEVEINT